MSEGRDRADPGPGAGRGGGGAAGADWEGATPDPGLDIVFAGNPLDRAGDRRKTPGFLEGALADPGSRFLELERLKVPVHDTPEGLRLAWSGPEALQGRDPEAPLVLLGLQGDVAHFALDVSGRERPSAPGGRFQGLRTVAPELPAGEAGIGAQARALLEWHRRHPYCALCGGRTTVTQGGLARRCRACGSEHFPRTDPVVITLAVRGERCLLGRSHHFPKGLFSALAGFMEPGESIEEAVRREIAEEAGIEVGRVRYVASQPWPFPASLMIGCLGEALSEEITLHDQELAEARWFGAGEIRAALAGESSDLRLPQPLAIAHQLLRAWLRSRP